MPVEIEGVFSKCVFPNVPPLAYFLSDRTFIEPELTHPELTDIVWNE